MNNTQELKPTQTKPIKITVSDGIINFLLQHNISLAFSSYQVGKFFLIGRNNQQGGLSVYQRNFARSMGLTAHGDDIYLSSLYQIWYFCNALAPEQTFQSYDKLYVPQTSYTTGQLDVHDMAVNAEGELIFVNTLFNCLAKISAKYSFQEIWRPSFISELVPEDKCHLNGLAMKNGQPKYITMFCQSNENESWRKQKERQGIIMDVQTNEIICQGLTMPHSPRFYRNKLWVLNSGTGYLGYVDFQSGQFREITFCPGYTRGLAFVGDYALVGLSTIRDSNLFGSQTLIQNLEKNHATAQCGIQIINLNTGLLEHQITLGGHMHEIYDVCILPNVVKPAALGIETNDIRKAIVIPEHNQQRFVELKLEF